MGLWQRRNLSRRLSAISPKDSRMPRPAPARVRNKCLTLAKTLKPMRRSSAHGWISMLPSIASWRPLTTKCPDIKNKKQSHSHIIASKPSFKGDRRNQGKGPEDVDQGRGLPHVQGLQG